MNSSKSALVAAIIGTAVLVVGFGLIFIFVPGHKKLAILNAEGNSVIVALDWIKVKNPPKSPAIGFLKNLALENLLCCLPAPSAIEATADPAPCGRVSLLGTAAAVLG